MAACVGHLVVLSCLWFCFGAVGVMAEANATKGIPVPIETAPFAASLRGLRQRRCTASVVHDRFLLTAASCLLDGAGGLINVTEALVGTNNLAKGGQLYAVQAVFPHEKYFIHTGDYNVGLVKLVQKIAFGPKVGPIRLGKRVRVGDLVNVVGWGSEMKSSTTVLQKVTVSVLRNNDCQGGLGRIIGPREMCAGAARGRGDCVGDEGGPVIANNTLVAVGTPFRCGALPALYTRVFSVRRWIRTTIDENSDIEF